LRKIIKFFTVLLFSAAILTGCTGVKTKPPQGAPSQAGSSSANQESQLPQPSTVQLQQVEVPAGNNSGTNPQSQPNPNPQAQEQNIPPTTSDVPALKDKPEKKKNYSLKVGDYFPLFTLPDLNGNKVSSAGLFSGNKVALVNFWGTFCNHCIGEMPGLENLRQKYSGQGFGLIGIVVNSRNVDNAKYIATKLGTGYPHLLDDGRFGSKIYAVPQTYLVNSSGKILQSVTGARPEQEFSQMIEPYLK